MSTSQPSSKLIFAPGSTTSPTTTPSRAPQYHLSHLSLPSLSPSPLTQFHNWYTSAQSSGVHQPETVCLSTAALPSGAISSRYVYLKELSADGAFVVYSNWATSRKAKDVASNPQASLAFWWREVERQVRVEGWVERLSGEESQVYFGTRVRGSKIGAWASEQSCVLVPEEGVREDLEGGKEGEGEGEDDGRRVLEKRVKEVEQRFQDVPDEDIPVPEFWGGLRVWPRMMEFWQGRDSRLHDRFRYTRVDEVGREVEGEEKGGGKWKIERLSP